MARYSDSFTLLYRPRTRRRIHRFKKVFNCFVSIRCSRHDFNVPLPINGHIYTFQLNLSIIMPQYLSNPPSTLHAMPASSPWFHHPDITWQVVQIIEFPVTPISADSCFILRRRCKYSPHHPIQRASVCVRDVISRPHKTRGKAIVVYIFTFIDSRQEDKGSALSHNRQSAPNLFTNATCICYCSPQILQLCHILYEGFIIYLPVTDSFYFVLAS
jgi:hypothetical protein